MKKSICILSFSPVAQDARVLRQIKYLAPHYKLTVIGHGQPHPDWASIPDFKWVPILREFNSSRGLKTIERILSLLGRIHPEFYNILFWKNSTYVHAFEALMANRCDAIHANDWNGLPVAAKAARQSGAHLVFDAHEWEEQRHRYSLVRRYLSMAEVAITVSPPIAERYQQEFGVKTCVVMNAPDAVLLPCRQAKSDQIRMIHHGAPKRERQLELMIQTLALCDQRYHLDFMLTQSEADYVFELKQLATDLAAGRVTFRDPVAPEKIVSCIAEYDLGFYLLPPIEYNLMAALPNKFFDYIAAGLAVCIGPSPAMAGITQQYGIGCVAPSFEPKDVANMLNQLTFEQVVQMQQAARQATKELNAAKEMDKVVELYKQLL
jgi:glycosyltransferase involved in cell wall biosynthesis